MGSGTFPLRQVNICSASFSPGDSPVGWARTKPPFFWEGALCRTHDGLLGRAGACEVALSGNLPGVESISDERSFCGPLMGILSVARKKAVPESWLLVVPVDMPGLSETVLRRLVNMAASGESAVHYHGYELPVLLRWNQKTRRGSSGTPSPRRPSA